MLKAKIATIYQMYAASLASSVGDIAYEILPNSLHRRHVYSQMHGHNLGREERHDDVEESGAGSLE